VAGAHIRIYKRILQRIIRKHSELKECEGMIYETIEDPDYIVEGHKGELLAIRHYDITPVGSKDMVVVYREDKGLVITAFLTSKSHKITKKRRIIWQKAK
jgi:hypothetical protein